MVRSFGNTRIHHETADTLELDEEDVYGDIIRRAPILWAQLNSIWVINGTLDEQGFCRQVALLARSIEHVYFILFHDLIIHLLCKYPCFRSLCLFIMLKMYFPIPLCTIPCKPIAISSVRVTYPRTTIFVYSYWSIKVLRPLSDTIS